MDNVTVKKAPSQPIKQDAAFLQTLLTKGECVSLYLINGVRLQGYILSFDTYTILVKAFTPNANGNQMLVYKSAISTIVATGNGNGQGTHSRDIATV